MNPSTLTAMGLSEPQAKAYICLIKEGQLTPPQVAVKIKESRTNAYKILERLEELELVRHGEHNGKLYYLPENPVALERLATIARNEVLRHEKQVRDTMPTLLDYFYAFSEQPGVRFYQGQDGIKQIFDDMLRTQKDIYLVRSSADIKFFDEQFFDAFRAKRAKRGITTHALTPDTTHARKNKAQDEQMKFLRTLIPSSSYTASVEWNAYGNKVAVISYGEEAMGMIIESPQIAESFRQLFALMQASQSNSARK